MNSEGGQLIPEPLSVRNKRAAKRIYDDALPGNGRIPFWIMRRMASKAAEMHVYRDGNVYCGMSCEASINGITFIVFLAVDGRMRSRGYGIRILDRIKADHPDHTIVASFESSAGGDCGLGSKAFYLRNGFAETGYAGTIGGRPQEIVVFNGEFDPGKFQEFFVKYSGGRVSPVIERVRT